MIYFLPVVLKGKLPIPACAHDDDDGGSGPTLTRSKIQRHPLNLTLLAVWTVNMEMSLLLYTVGVYNFYMDSNEANFSLLHE